MNLSPCLTLTLWSILLRFVRSQNVKPPVFSEPYYNISMPEDSAIRISPVTATATDPDTGSNSGVRYTLNDTRHFEIGQTSGVVTYRGGLNYDNPALRELTLSITAAYAVSPLISSTVPFYIHVEDINDERPVFRQQLYNAQIVNGSEAGGFVIQVQADDKDSNSELLYSLLIDTEFFEINNITGVITTSQEVDRTAIQSELPGLTLQIRVSDGLRTDTAPIRLKIVDPNKFVPEFAKSVFEGSVDEGTATDKVPVLKVNASDGDSGQQAVLSYSLVETNYSGNFEIDSDTGQIWFVGSLDRESLPAPGTITLHVLVLDKGLPPASANATVNIVINDVDDNGPKFQENYFEMELAENFPNDMKITSLPKAVDADIGSNAVVHYNLSAAGLQYFDIDQSTGDLLTKFSCRQTCPLTNVSEIEFQLFAYNAANPEIAGDFIWINIKIVAPPPTTTPSGDNGSPRTGGALEGPVLAMPEIIAIIVVSCVVLLIIVVVILVLLLRRSKMQKMKDKIEFNPSNYPPEKVENEVPCE